MALYEVLLKDTLGFLYLWRKADELVVFNLRHHNCPGSVGPLISGQAHITIFTSHYSHYNLWKIFEVLPGNHKPFGYLWVSSRPGRLISNFQQQIADQHSRPLASSSQVWRREYCGSLLLGCFDCVQSQPKSDGHTATLGMYCFFLWSTETILSRLDSFP